MFKAENDLKEALRNSEAQYRLLFEHANVGIFIAQDGYLKVPNPYLSQILGYSRAELEEQPFSLFIPEYLSLLNTRHQERLSGKTGLPQTYDFRVISKNGTIIWVQLSTILIQLKGRPATLNFLHDITEHKRIDKALRESEEKYRILFEHTSEALFVAQDDQIVFQNPRSSELSGYSAEEFQSRPFVDFIHENDREMVMDRHLRRLNWNQIEEYIYKHSEARFSHGICQECFKKYYPDMEFYVES